MTGSGHTFGLLAGGRMGRLIAEKDWSATPLGPMDRWPETLKTMVGLMLRTRQPAYVAWGPEQISLYNDGYIPILGAKHPEGLGQPAQVLWAEIWDTLGPLNAAVLAGEAQWFEDMPFELAGRERPRSWFSFSCTPIPGEDGRPAGIYCVATETTDKVLAENQGKAEREHLGRMFEQAPGFIAMLEGPEHRFTLTNAAYRRLIGDRDVMGRGAREALPEVEGQGFFELLDKVYASGEPFRGAATPILLAREPGQPREQRFIDFVYQPVLGSEGSVSGIFVEGSDVTEAYLAQQALRASEARYRTLFEAIDAGFSVLEMIFEGERPVDYRFIEVNPAFERQTGLVDAVGRTAREMLPDLEPHWFEIYGRVAQTGEPIRFESSSQVMGRWFEVYAFPVGDPPARRAAILFTDITARKRADAHLHELNQTLESRIRDALAERQVLADIVESSNAAVMACDLGYGIIAINRTTAAEIERVYGKRPKLGDNLLELLADMPEHQAQVAKNWGRALAGEEFMIVEEFGDSAHERAAFEVRFNVLRDRDGQRMGASQTAYDVSDRVRAQAELELAQEALRQSQKMEAMGQLTGGVAHDFNNLLTPIVAVLDRLQRQGLGAERDRRLIAGAAQSAERAKTLVQRLLAFARRQPLQAQAVDVASLIREMAELVASTIGPHIRVVAEVPEDLPLAHADANQLEMALLNLGVNARDAMQDGGTLRITASAETVGSSREADLRPGDYIRLSVADTGAGMDEATLGRAVEPFFSTKGVGKGTGLGLSIVHGLASQLGGALTIRSRPGLGTNVELWLPQSSAAPGFVVAAAAAEPGLLGRGTALVVDDEDLVRLTTADMLSELGYTVLEAASGEEALELLERGNAVDLLVTDHLMPGLNGTELARMIRASWPGMPVLVASGYAESEGIAPDLPRLNKPFRKDELVASLTKLATSKRK